MFALDSNVLVRYLTQDINAPEQVKKANHSIDRLTPDDPAFISCVVLCEVLWVLKTAYKSSKEWRVGALKKIISTAEFNIERLECCAKALKHYERGKADFSDYLIREIARHEGYDVVLTFDTEALQNEGFQQP